MLPAVRWSRNRRLVILSVVGPRKQTARLPRRRFLGRSLQRDSACLALDGPQKTRCLRVLGSGVFFGVLQRPDLDWEW
jgi:hypothetical protein